MASPNADSKSLTPAQALIGHGSSLVMIDNQFIKRLNLKCRPLKETPCVHIAIGEAESELKEWVKVKPCKKDISWCSKPLEAAIVPQLCTPLLLGSPFLAANSMVLDHASRTANDKVSNVEILSICPLEPAPLQKRSSPKERALRILSASASA